MSDEINIIIQCRCDYFIIKMSSPSRAENEIQAEIFKRIHPNASSSNDLDFYVRKVRRLESDNNILQDDLNKIRVRLRRAEDFEIKFELLTSENANLKKEVDTRDKSMRELKTLNEKLSFVVNDRSSKQEEWAAQKRGLLEEVEKWTLKAEENEIRRVTELAEERSRSQDAIKRQIMIMRKDFDDQEEQLKFQVRQLKKVLLQKQTVEAIITGRVEKVRRQKDEEISRLIQVVQDQKQHKAQALQDKNEQINRLKEKFQKMVNFQLQNLKKNLDDQGEVFSIELNGLKEIISIKNDQISKLLVQIKRQATDHASDRKELQAEIALLKDSIYKNQRQSELELYNLRQKLMQIQAADLKSLEARYSELIQHLREEKAELDGFLLQKNRLRQLDRKDHERSIHELNDKIKEREQRINSLLDRIKQSGDVNTGQLKDLHQSFHKIEVEKENQSSQYASNINFMTQQIAKLTSSNEVKNIEIKKLQEELHQVKHKFEEDLKQLDNRNKLERKERDEEKERDRKEREQMIQKMAAYERDYKNSQRRLLRQKQKEEREKNKLKFMVQELERDIQRLNKYIKSLDQNLKSQYKKNQMTILDGDGSRREVTSTLNKQKVQIETLKSIEIDQVKRKYDIQSTRILQQNEKLKTDLLSKSVALQKAEAELKRLDYQQRNMEKINRDRLLEYEKKMATMNNEINLTQHLYKTFMEAKARKQ